jgi:hypothetical protein
MSDELRRLPVLIAQQPTAADAFDAHRLSGKAFAQRSRILEFIKSRGGTWSIGELAHAMDLEKSTVSARLNELLYETHELIEAERRKDRRSGILIRPVMLPKVGQMGLFA